MFFFFLAVACCCFYWLSCAHGRFHFHAVKSDHFCGLGVPVDRERMERKGHDRGSVPRHRGHGVRVALLRKVSGRRRAGRPSACVVCLPQASRSLTWTPRLRKTTRLCSSRNHPDHRKFDHCCCTTGFVRVTKYQSLPSRGVTKNSYPLSMYVSACTLPAYTEYTNDSPNHQGGPWQSLRPNYSLRRRMCHLA